MSLSKTKFIKALREGYEIAKKPIAYILMFTALLLESPMAEFLPIKIQGIAYSIMIIVLALILMEMLFAIYENVLKEDEGLQIIGQGELHEKILAMVIKEKNVSIKYIGVAGRIGWTGVISKLIDENDPDSLVSNRTKYKIEMALLNPKVQSDNPELYKKFSETKNISESVQSAAKYLPKISMAGSEITLHHYDHMPNMLGFLINENYLFITHTYWEQRLGKMELRAGGTDYFVYDTRDLVGGQEFIRRFNGWFDYITHPSQG